MKVGDRVMTSGLDGIFPKGMVIGEVVDVGRRHRGLLQVGDRHARASRSIALEEVLVVDADRARSGEPPA